MEGDVGHDSKKYKMLTPFSTTLCRISVFIIRRHLEIRHVRHHLFCKFTSFRSVLIKHYVSCSKIRPQGSDVTECLLCYIPYQKENGAEIAKYWQINHTFYKNLGAVF